MKSFVLIAIIVVVGCSTVSAECRWKATESIPIGTQCNVQYGRFVFQEDGNAVIYDGNNKPLWNTGTAGIGHSFVFQNDGNLVMYSRAGVPVWNSHTANKGGENLIFQDDRNFVIYNKAFKHLWHTSTVN
ncbi:hypothetical protein HA402_007094 [Bradysia odoriphaga]|nr:hypothetical protein HA402_007094 [Bradysia odoriphaga]